MDQAAHLAPENGVYYPALDGLRAVAFLLVFGQHYLSLLWGWAGVNIFFVLSGFLITGILYDTRDAPRRARTFYMRRTLRIFPLYYGVFAVLLLVQPWAHWRWSAAWLAWPLYFGNLLRFVSRSYAPGGAMQSVGDGRLESPTLSLSPLYLGHFWSLCVEEQFYLVWPWVVFSVKRKRILLWVCAGTVVMMPLVRVLVQRAAPAWMLQAELLYRITPFQLDALLLGGFVALLWRGRFRAALLRSCKAVAVVAALFVVVYLAATIQWHAADWYRSYPYPAWRLTWGLSFINVFAAAVLVCALQPAGWICRALSLPALRWIGRLSYGAYVLHDLLHTLYLHIVVLRLARLPFIAAHAEGATAVLGLAMTLLIAWLSARFFERPFLRLKKRWTIPAVQAVAKRA